MISSPSQIQGFNEIPEVTFNGPPAESSSLGDRFIEFQPSLPKLKEEKSNAPDLGKDLVYDDSSDEDSFIIQRLSNQLVIKDLRIVDMGERKCLAMINQTERKEEQIQLALIEKITTLIKIALSYLVYFLPCIRRNISRLKKQYTSGMKTREKTCYTYIDLTSMLYTSGKDKFVYGQHPTRGTIKLAPPKNPGDVWAKIADYDRFKVQLIQMIARTIDRNKADILLHLRLPRYRLEDRVEFTIPVLTRLLCINETFRDNTALLLRST